LLSRAYPAAEQTWLNFKTHFLGAQRNLPLQQTTPNRQVSMKPNAVLHQDAIANLATASAPDRKPTNASRNSLKA